MRKIPALVVLTLLTSVDTRLATAADDSCRLDLKVERVFRYGRFPAALVTVRHDCAYAFHSVTIACTWLAVEKPVAAGRGSVANLHSKTLASRDIVSASGHDVEFDSAHCRVETTQR